MNTPKPFDATVVPFLQKKPDTLKVSEISEALIKHESVLKKRGVSD